MIVNFVPRIYIDPQTHLEKVLYKPLIDVFLVCQHRVGKPVKCLVDSGSDFNIFPWEYATAFLGFSDRTVSTGKVIGILGVGGNENKAYCQRVTIENPHFSFKDVPVYFMKDQPMPLLGRIGFMDRFEKIIFDERNKVLEFILN